VPELEVEFFKRLVEAPVEDEIVKALPADTDQFIVLPDGGV